MPRSPQQAREAITEAVERIDRELVTAETPDWGSLVADASVIWQVAFDQRRAAA